MTSEDTDYKKRYEDQLKANRQLLDAIEKLQDNAWSYLQYIESLRRDLARAKRPTGFYGTESLDIEIQERDDESEVLARQAQERRQRYHNRKNPY